MIFRATYRDGSMAYYAVDTWQDALDKSLREGRLEVLRLVSNEGEETDLLGRALVGSAHG